MGEFESSEEGHDDDTDDQEIKNNRLDYDDYEEKENNKNNDCKRLDEMSDQEMMEHFRLVNNMTAEEVFRDDPVMRSSQQMLLDTPDDDDQDPVSVKTSSSYVGTSASTDNDCSSISSDTAPLPQLLDHDDQRHTSHPPLQTLSRLSSVSTAPLHDDEQEARDAVAPDDQLSQSGVASPSEDNTEKVASLEKPVATLQSMVLGLSAQVDTLTTKMDDSSFESGLLNKTVEMLQEKNTRLTQSLGTLEARNTVLEKSLLEVTQHVTNNDEVKTLRERFLEILSSCESFQENFDSMSEKQVNLDAGLETVVREMEEVRSDNMELKEEFNKMQDKFSSLKLEYQVDRGQHKVQLDNLAYQLALVSNNKTPGAESISSTSGVKSDEDPDDLDKVIFTSDSLIETEQYS